MSDQANPQESKPRWQPVGAIDRRVLGVLVEKAKTTPNAYPMSTSAIVTAANQKNNRFPVMQLEPDDVEESLERLRELGAVGMIQGMGRVVKYRHYLYEWLGVDKLELAVMAELLLRGAQTEGELRGRAARMEPINDLGSLRPVLNSLKEKGLVIPLTPEGRGHVVTHALYKPRELENLKTQFAQGGHAALAPSDEEPPAAVPQHAPMSAPRASAAPAVAAPAPAAASADLAGLRRQVEDLEAQVSELRSDLDATRATLSEALADFERLRRDLGA